MNENGKKEMHTCARCGVNDNNIDHRIMHDIGDYSDYTGVEYYDDGDPRLPETLDPGWYCNTCVIAAKDAWWREEQKAYIFDNCGNTPDDEDFYWD